MEDESELLTEVREIRKLLELLAEPAVAERDAKLRRELRRIVGRSALSQKSVLLMKGQMRQTDIQSVSKIAKGDLSKLVKKLSEAKLLGGDIKLPQLAIPVPPNFFDDAANSD